MSKQQKNIYWNHSKPMRKLNIRYIALIFNINGHLKKLQKFNSSFMVEDWQHYWSLHLDHNLWHSLYWLRKFIYVFILLDVSNISQKHLRTSTFINQFYCIKTQIIQSLYINYQYHLMKLSKVQTYDTVNSLQLSKQIQQDQQMLEKMSSKLFELTGRIQNVEKKFYTATTAPQSKNKTITHINIIPEKNQVQRKNQLALNIKNYIPTKEYPKCQIEKQVKIQQKLDKIHQTLEKLVNVLINKFETPLKNQQNQNKLANKQLENEQIKKKKIQVANQTREVQQKFITEADLNNYSSEYESRLKNIHVKLPLQNCERDELLIWVGQMCKKVLSVGFKLYKNDELDINKVKVFCSQNILRNLIRLPVSLKKMHWQAIDNCLKNQLFPYYRFNYPQTEEKGVSSKLSNLLIQKDTLNQNQNDMCLKSGIKFELQEDGNYNPQIMEFLNYIMRLPNLPPGLKQTDKDEIFNTLSSIMKMSNLPEGLIHNQKEDEFMNNLGRLFKKDMEKIFQFVQAQQNILDIQSFNPKKGSKLINDQNIQNYINKNFKKIQHVQLKEGNQQIKDQKQKNPQTKQYDFLGTEQTILEKKDQMQQISLVLQKQGGQHELLLSSRELSRKQSGQNQKELLQYKQKVRAYTTKQIGQKISENLQLFTRYQIQTGNLKLKNSALMRVVTKWCQQLEKCFDPKEIMNRQNPWKMKDGSESYLKMQEMTNLNKLLQEQKQIINKKLQQITKNNYQNQIQFTNREVNISLRKFSLQQATVGQFCSSVFKINESYLIKYLNLLIHGINRALFYFQKFQWWSKCVPEQLKKVLEQHQVNIKAETKEDIKNIQQVIKNNPVLGVFQLKSDPISETPQLITFNIGDLLRCKCTSKDIEITALYKFVEYLSQTKPQFIKILRLKNKLNQGNKDILMNILYRESIVVEMQLAIKSDKSKFIECSNKFNHYFYEMERSQFGPIMEMCSIWCSQDQRAKFYLQKIDKSNKRVKDVKPNKCCTHLQNLEPTDLPFTCQVCSYCYYDCNFYQKHSNCKVCRGQVCSFCLYQQSDEENKYEAFPLLKQIQDTTKQDLKICLQMPLHGGKLLNLNSKEKKIKTFKTIIYNKQFYIFNQTQSNEQKEMQLIEKFKLKQSDYRFLSPEQVKKQIQNWFEDFTISNLVFQNEQLVAKYQKLSRIQLKQLQKQWEKQCLQKYFFPKYMEKIQKSEKKSAAQIKKDLASDLFQSVKIINSVQKLNFSQNRLQQIKVLNQKFPKTQFAVLNNNGFETIQRYDIRNWSESLTHLYLNENRIKDISSFCELRRLVGLNLSNNRIQNIQDSVFKSLRQLKYLDLSENKLRNFQISRGDLINLEKLNISYNQIACLPQFFGNLRNLTDLNAHKNKLINLPESFQNLKKLMKLSLSQNLLQSLPASIGSLKSLVKLNLYQNKLSQLPKSLCRLNRLRSLNIFSNPIKNLPEQFGNLSSLNKLCLFSQQGLQFPSSISNLKQLKRLIMIGKQQSKFPKDILRIKSLEELVITIICDNIWVQALNLNSWPNLKRLSIKLSSQQNPQLTQQLRKQCEKRSIEFKYSKPIKQKVDKKDSIEIKPQTS